MPSVQPGRPELGKPLLQRRTPSPTRERLYLFGLGLACVAMLAAGLLAFRALGIVECSIGAGAGAQRDFAVLLTGFEPFGNHSTNPTESVVALLNNSCRRGVCFESHVLPVTRAGAHHSAALVRSRPWDAVVHLGFEDHAKGLKVEVVAKNVQARDGSAPPAPAGAGPCHGETPVVPGARCLLPTTADLGALQLPVLVNGVAPAEAELWSRDAGTYFCNEVYFRSVHLARSVPSVRTDREGRLMPVVFVHMPQLAPPALTAAHAAVFVEGLAAAIVEL